MPEPVMKIVRPPVVFSLGLKVIGLVVFFGVVPAVFAQDAPPLPAAAQEKKYPAFGLSENDALLAQGGRTYRTYCIGCHGAAGDGQGAAASFLNPKPRNFKTAEFRFSSRPSGDLPTDEDLFRTVTEGLRGTSMPAWNLLPERDRWAVIAYIKTFAPDKWKDAQPGQPTAIAEDPYYGQSPEQAIQRGETAYHGMAMCYSCHAAYIGPEKINEARKTYGMPPMKVFRPDLGAPKSMTTSDGSVIVPPDFTWNKLKRGTESRSLYHVIGNGISGTPMPTWKGILPEEDLWGIVYYVQHLAARRPGLVTPEAMQKHEAGIKKADEERIQFEEAMKKLDAEEKQKKEEAEKLKKIEEEKLKAAAAAAAANPAGSAENSAAAPVPAPAVASKESPRA